MSEHLRIGTLIGSEEPAVVLARKLNRHTFWCGQSGSGKTYALGVLLEQVLLHTETPLVILDPNSDFVHLDDLVPDAPAAEADEFRRRRVRVLRPHAEGDDRLAVRFLDMPVRSRAAVLELDPVLDAEDFNTMLRIERDVRQGIDQPLVAWLRGHDDVARDRIATRLENLGIAEWPLWAWGGTDAADVVDDRPDATVVDLGGFDALPEAHAAALALLDHLWERRAERIGRIIVLDEAHNLCPPDPATPLQRLLTQRIVQIAAEGRKYGLWLLLSTQRPSKIHPNVLSQCDNLGLLRMNSSSDLAEIAAVMGFAPADLLGRSPSFMQGEALFAGGFVAEPQLARMGRRLTVEGGSDVAVVLR